MKINTTGIRLRICGGLAAVTGLLLLAGCFTLSVNPFYERQDLVWEAGLLGVWGDPEDSAGETWQFLSAGGDGYQLVIRKEDSLRINPETDGVFSAHLFRLEDQLYLDLFPDEPADAGEFYLSHVVPAHSVWQVDLAGDGLVLKILETNLLQNAIDDGRLSLDYVERDEVQVLTAGSDDLRAMLISHGDEFFGEGEPLQRIQ